MANNRVTELLGIEYPIIQAGMVWVSGGKLAAASANAGILGVIGAGSMQPDLLKEQIQKAKSLTKYHHRLAVNIPILYHRSKEQIDIALKEGIQTFITAAGSPKLYTPYLKEKGKTVIHVTASPLLAKKCEDAGVDMIIAEGFEAGGHNGRDEITTMCLIPQVVDNVSIPVIAAGGIGDGRGILAALSLGAEAVQMGTRFVNTIESSAHDAFKEAIINASASDTLLTLKELVPTRLLKNPFFEEVEKLKEQNGTKEQFQDLLGKGRAKKGMHDGDLIDGELEIGQICGMIEDCPTVQELVDKLVAEYKKAKEHIARI